METKKKALVFLADGFEEVEALTPVDILRRGGVEVLLISVSGQKMVESAHGVRLETDCLIEELTDAQKEVDAYILPGGMPGSTTLAEHKGVQALLIEANKAGKFLAAICAAPMALGGWGLLQGKEAICYPGFEKFLTGAKISSNRVAKDGNIITAKGVGAGFAFGYAILGELLGEEVVSRLKEQMIWQD